MDVDEAIQIIEEKSVYRLQAADTDGGGMFTSTNGMPTTHWTKKKILKLAEIMKNKPEGMG